MSSFDPVKSISDYCPPEPSEDKSVLLYATTVIIICYSSSKKLIHVIQDFSYLAYIPALCPPPQLHLSVLSFPLVFSYHGLGLPASDLPLTTQHQSPSPCFSAAGFDPSVLVSGLIQDLLS